MLIGEVARRCGVSARMLRHYETLGLVRPTGRTGTGYRAYAEDDLRRIFHVESLRSLGLSLREVARALDDPGFSPAGLVDDLIRRTGERLAAETELLTRLRRIDAAGPADWDDVLQAVALLRALGSASPRARQRAALASATEAPAPVDALVDAVLAERDPNVAGALRWALARAGQDALAPLSRGLGSPDAAVRRRAVRAVAGLPPGPAVTEVLREAHRTSPDVAVRRHAALTLGARGVADAVPTLVDMVVVEVNDVDAADALSTLAARPAPAERIAALLVERLAHRATGPAARRRLTQALAGIPGPTATRALADLCEDEDRAVALTASYVLGMREGPG
ncbi:MerR family transcriptional regulator [Streptomyces solincola]|uniref:MerR family transcriptional regulator n=1 Tax=Streptomyces solincola TaxID=2100817 RepID=A0A2S9Q0P4_9ACTN|nr:HEAT repeat domain-containing protein [Streptomyces solincola]PRH80241.1 MerR family transcriptional regulator [Streptomyces solincola]